MNAIPVLRSKLPGEQARLLGNVRNYVTNDGFVNLLQTYDINNKQKDASLHRQFQAFAGVPGLAEQVRRWLAS